MANRVGFTKVQSSNITAIGYDRVKKELHMKFHYSQNKVYVYEGVSAAVHRNLMNAASIGKYFHSYVRYKYTEGKGYYD